MFQTLLKIKENKTNKKMMILSAIGIIIVVLGHTCDILGLASSIFPYASFNMALFVFISGYFYKTENEQNLLKKDGYIIKKIKRLVIPYFIWNLVYALIILVLQKLNIINFGAQINLYNFFIVPWQNGQQYIFNLAAWFMIALFLVNIVYVLIRKVLTYFKSWNNHVVLFELFILAYIAVLISNKYKNPYLIPLTRTMFFMFFYHFGYYYKTYLEGKIKIRNMVVLIGLIAIELILSIIDGAIQYDSFIMGFYTSNAIVPICASLTAILFWTKIAEILEPALEKSKTINYIGNNTYEIMMHHIFWIFIFNTFILAVTTLLNVNGFNIEKYKNNIYYFWYPKGNPQFIILYTIVAISGPLLIKYLYTKIRCKIALILKKENS